MPVGDVPHYRGGVSLPIRWAQVAIGGHSVHAEAAQGSSSVAINLELEEGQQELFASFYDDRERSIAPYYVCVKPLDVVSRRQ